jgi:hypothetical protein
MNDLTAEQLLAAVGVTPWDDPDWWPITLWDFENKYTGPDLNSETLDAILLVAGQKWCLAEGNCKYSPAICRAFSSDIWEEELIWLYPNPGHALARAIAEVKV